MYQYACISFSSQGDSSDPGPFLVTIATNTLVVYSCTDVQYGVDHVLLYHIACSDWHYFITEYLVTMYNLHVQCHLHGTVIALKQS